MTTKLDQALELLAQADSLREQGMQLLIDHAENHNEMVLQLGSFMEDLGRARDQLKTGPRVMGSKKKFRDLGALKKYYKIPQTKKDWQAHALKFLEVERKAEDVVEHLTTLGYGLHQSTITKWFASRVKYGILRRLARGHYHLHPKYRSKRSKTAAL